MNELLKRSFVTAAQSVHGESSRVVSRLTTTTGVHQRDVTSLLRGSLDEAPPPRSLAAEVFAQWTNDPAYRSAKGPRVLPRVGDVPSFESLAQAVTRDVHPRSVLDEICRLGVATPNAQGDTVALSASVFNPHKDQARMLSFVGVNVGDRASAAVENVIEGGGRYFEQAVFADALSAAPV